MYYEYEIMTEDLSAINTLLFEAIVWTANRQVFELSSFTPRMTPSAVVSLIGNFVGSHRTPGGRAQ